MRDRSHKRRVLSSQTRLNRVISTSVNGLNRSVQRDTLCTIDVEIESYSTIVLLFRLVTSYNERCLYVRYIKQEHPDGVGTVFPSGSYLSFVHVPVLVHKERSLGYEMRYLHLTWR